MGSVTLRHLGEKGTEMREGAMTLHDPTLPLAYGAGSAPPEVVLRAELHVGADQRDLHRDEHGQNAHHEAEAEDVVEVPLPPSPLARVSRPHDVLPQLSVKEINALPHESA